MARRKQAVFEEIVPSSDWTEDSSCHILFVDLPGILRFNFAIIAAENTRVAHDKGFQEATRETRWHRAGLLGSFVEVLSKNKGIVVTGVLAFSLGMSSVSKVPIKNWN